MRGRDRALAGLSWEGAVKTEANREKKAGLLPASSEPKLADGPVARTAREAMLAAMGKNPNTSLL